MTDSICLSDVKPGMKLKSTFSNDTHDPTITVIEMMDNGFTYKFDDDVLIGPRYGYISKDSVNQSYAFKGRVYYKIVKDEESAMVDK